MPLCNNDYAFGPGASCRPLDFTLLFSNVFLSFVPAAILLIFTGARVPLLLRKQRRLLPIEQLPMHGLVLLLSKGLLALSLFGASIATWIVWETTQELEGQWSGWVSSVFETIASASIVAAVLLEHIHSARPSQVSALYLTLSVVLTASRIRTISFIAPLSHAPLVLSIAIACKLLLFISLQFSSRSSLISGSTIPPSDTAGLVSRYFLAWVVPLLYRGYKSPLGMDDLGSIDRSLHSAATWDAFSSQWFMERSKHDAGQQKQPLFWAVVRSFFLLLVSPIFPYFVNSWVSMARPLVILDTVNFVESYLTPSKSKPASEGWGLVGGTFLIYFIYSITNALGEVAAQRGALAIRGALMEAIYRKSLLIRIETAREMGAAKASNLMSVDVRNIVNNLPFIHEVWTAILMTGIGLWIIYIQIGLSFLAAVGGAIVFFLFLPLLVKDIGNARTGWAEATDRRVKFMASVLKHIKAIKMSAYEPFVTDKAVHLRQTEINALVAWIVEILKVSIATNWLGNFLSLITVTTFTLVSIYSRNSGGQVTTAGVFAVISTIQLISNPLLMLGQRWSSLVTAWASFKRIEDFLLCDEKEEFIAVQTGDELQSLGETKAGIRIRLDHASFGVHNQITLLNDLNVNIVTPNLWMLVGRVGSGKSIMLQSLLGELDHISGTCDVSLGTVGFCSQDPWLRANGSIRDNITFMHPYDQSWYSTVIRAVGLDTDLKLMADGDTRVTSSLSGGQRQRVALARAIYGKFDTLVLDDVFSALDADTEAHVFNALFGPSGILRDRSVILATNQVYRLAYASWITMLHEGSIIEQGQYADLMSGHTEVSKLVTEFAAGKASKAAEADITTDLLIQPEEEEKALDGVQDVGSTDGQDQEVSKRGAVAWSTYLLYLRGMGLLYASVWVGLVIVVAAINTSINVYLQAFTTTLVGSSRSEYGVFLGGYAALNIGYLVIFAVAIIYAFKYAHPLASIRLHRWMLVGMLRTGLDFFDSRGLGQVINRFNSDLSLIDMELPNSALNFMFEATTIAGSAILIIIAGPYMAAVLAGAAFVMTILQRFYLRSGRELRRLDLTSKSPIFTLFSETIDPDGLRTIRAMKAQETCLALMTAHTTASQHPAWLIMVVRKWLELALTLCVTAINTLLVLVAVINRHSTSAGILAAAMASAASMTGAIVWLVVEWTNVEVGITSVERVQEYIELPPQQDCSVSSSALDPEWLKSGALSFQHLSVRYRPELPLALDDVSFEVKPGQRVGICGRTGSGKSTLLGVMWRLIDHEDDSRILVGGRDIRTVPLPAYRSAVSIIPQDPLLLELSLRDNLDPEGLHTDADLWNALERAQLKPHIETLSCKLDEMMAGDGGSFSRGQRQLLALARAILRNRPVLALDEATSSIDVKTDAAIQRTIRESFEGATVLTIAHRISTIIDYDLIVVMDAGRLVEIGSPQVLLGKRDGHFKRLALENGAISESSGSDPSRGNQSDIVTERRV